MISLLRRHHSGSYGARVVALLQPRLDASHSEDDSTADEEIEDEEETEDFEETTEEGDEDADGEDDSQEDTLDLGHSKLKAFYDFLRDDDRVEKFLKDVPETKKKKSKSSEKTTPEEELTTTLRSLLRPAMIVDGQHRVFGAYTSDNAKTINFTVNAISDADWIEQVFQFVVLNKQAKPISSSFLSSILNTSLTNDEVQDIEKRLSDVGIKNSERKILKYLNHNTNSPFHQMVSEPGELAGVDNRGRLSDKA